MCMYYLLAELLKKAYMTRLPLSLLPLFEATTKENHLSQQSKTALCLKIFRFGLHQRPTKGGRNTSRDSETGSGILTKSRNGLLRKFEQELDLPPCVHIEDGSGGRKELEGSVMGPFAFEDVTGCSNGLLDSPLSLRPSAACWAVCLTIRCRRGCILYSVKRTTFAADIKASPTPCQTEHQKRPFASNALLLRFTFKNTDSIPPLTSHLARPPHPPQSCGQQPSSSLSASPSSLTQHPKAPQSQTAPLPSQPPNSAPATPLNAWP